MARAPFAWHSGYPSLSYTGRKRPGSCRAVVKEAVKDRKQLGEEPGRTESTHGHSLCRWLCNRAGIGILAWFCLRSEANIWNSLGRASLHIPGQLCRKITEVLAPPIA